MDTRNFLAAGAVVAATAAGSALATAAPPGNDNDIVGSWFGTVTATNPPLGSFNELISFMTGGVVIESRRYSVPGTPFGTLLETRGTAPGRRRAATRSRRSSASSSRTRTPATRSAPTTCACS